MSSVSDEAELARMVTARQMRKNFEAHQATCATFGCISYSATDHDMCETGLNLWSEWMDAARAIMPLRVSA